MHALLMILAALLHASGNPSANSGAETICGVPVWSQTPVVESDLFKGTLRGECSITGTEGRGLSGLAAALVEAALASEKVNAGPTAETYETLPSTYLDVTNTSQTRDTLTVRSDRHVATDQLTALIYADLSKQISGTGNSAQLRKIDIGFRIEPRGPGAWQIVLTDSLQVKRPWYVPTSQFKSMVQTSAQDEFVKGRDQILPSLVMHL
jgi:hypothetical protein